MVIIIDKVKKIIVYKWYLLLWKARTQNARHGANTRSRLRTPSDMRNFPLNECFANSWFSTTNFTP